jgi:hypothetical protein
MIIGGYQINIDRMRGNYGYIYAPWGLFLSQDVRLKSGPSD